MRDLLNKLRTLYNHPGLVAGVIFSLIIGTLVLKIVTRDETQIVPVEDGKAMTGDSDASMSIQEAQAIMDAERSFSLAFPLACTLGEDCWIARYVDREAGDTAADYTCGASTQNGHKGTDIALSDLSRMEAGVSVVAAASGEVLRLRDGVDDVSVRETGKDGVDGKECGNGIVLDHGNGWQTQYCHLKEGSLAVKRGDRVEAGDILGQVGMSGLTEFPHLHFTTRLNKDVVDPFDGGKLETHCDADGQTLWQEKLSYQNFIPLPAQFSTEPKDLANMWQPSQRTMASDSPAMLLVGRGFHPHRSDKWHFTLTDPDGNVRLDEEIILEKNHQIYVGYMGIEKPDGGFKPGIWKGEIHVDRGPWDDYDQTIEIEVIP
ncbi:MULTISPECIES: M23 family metallopeptidase [Kordiimonas]|jgi:hypothetical protein|uniref:M23 family metallopeptidase n=1 Tax=Kordiimonas TaxID=288021 RepID=UPI00257D35FD|nr:M23 family metallopeptidase [Kordiimonas sp. UBA4487]